MLNWDITKAEGLTIDAIVARAMSLQHPLNAQTRMQWQMDIIGCHANGCPLALDLLMAATDGDFIHDVFGISRHINRRTGRLLDFGPRYALANHQQVAA